MLNYLIWDSFEKKQVDLQEIVRIQISYLNTLLLIDTFCPR